MEHCFLISDWKMQADRMMFLINETLMEDRYDLQHGFSDFGNGYFAADFGGHFLGQKEQRI